MNFSDNGINILKQCEGCVKRNERHVIYDDKTGTPVPPGVPLPTGATIGYGHLIKPGEDFSDGIDENAATNLLSRDVETAKHAVQNNIFATLSQNQYDALVILAFNIGAKNFATSTVAKYINNPNFHSTQYPTLQSAWFAWNKSGGHEKVGLNRRREIEWKLFCAI